PSRGASPTERMARGPLLGKLPLIFGPAGGDASWDEGGPRSGGLWDLAADGLEEPADPGDPGAKPDKSKSPSESSAPPLWLGLSDIVYRVLGCREVCPSISRAFLWMPSASMP